MLYATREEAAEILDWAKGRGLTGNNYEFWGTISDRSRANISP